MSPLSPHDIFLKRFLYSSPVAVSTRRLPLAECSPPLQVHSLLLSSFLLFFSFIFFFSPFSFLLLFSTITYSLFLLFSFLFSSLFTILYRYSFVIFYDDDEEEEEDISDNKNYIRDGEDAYEEDDSDLIFCVLL